MLLLTLALIGTFHTRLYSQEFALQSQFFLNPYLYNPAVVGQSRYTEDRQAEVSLLHRQQWVGIEGAPVTSSLTLQLPMRRKLGLGLQLSTDKRGILTTSVAHFTAGYRVKLGPEQFLSAGLSLGAGNHGLDMAAVDNTNDPALLAVSASSFFTSGKAGLHYRMGSLNLGVALPELFSSKVVSSDRFNQLKVSSFDQLMITGSYRFALTSDERFFFEPQLYYRFSKVIPSQYEALGIFYYQDVAWLGGSYRQNYGPTAFGGIKIKDVFRIGYAYELASHTSAQPVGGFSGSSHELFLSLQFGEKKTDSGRQKRNPAATAADFARKERQNERLAKEKVKQRTAKPKKPVAEKAAPAKTGDDAQVNQPPVDNKQQQSSLPVDSLQNKSGRKQSHTPQQKLQRDQREKEKISILKRLRSTLGGKPKPNKNKEDADTENPSNASENESFAEQDYESKKETIKEGSGSDKEITKGYYVTVGAFEVKANALAYAEEVKALGYACEYHYSSENKYYYVQVLGTANLDEAKAKWQEIRKNRGFEETWVLTVNDFNAGKP